MSIEHMREAAPENGNEDVDRMLDRLELRSELESVGQDELAVDLTPENQEQIEFMDALSVEVERFIQNTVTPLAEAQRYEELDQIQGDFLKHLKKSLKRLGFEKKWVQGVVDAVDRLMEAHEADIKQGNKPSFKRVMLTEAFYCVPFVGPTAMFIESKLGWTLAGERLTKKQQWWREKEAAFWAVADCTGAGEVARAGKAGAKVTTKAGARLTSAATKVGVKKAAAEAGGGAARRVLWRKAGSATHKIKEGGKFIGHIRKEKGVVKGALAFGREARSGGEALKGLAWKAGHETADKGMDLVWGNGASARKLRKAREEVDAQLEKAA